MRYFLAQFSFKNLAADELGWKLIYQTPVVQGLFMTIYTL